MTLNTTSVSSPFTDRVSHDPPLHPRIFVPVQAQLQVQTDLASRLSKEKKGAEDRLKDTADQLQVAEDKAAALARAKAKLETQVCSPVA